VGGTPLPGKFSTPTRFETCYRPRRDDLRHYYRSLFDDELARRVWEYRLDLVEIEAHPERWRNPTGDRAVRAVMLEAAEAELAFRRRHVDRSLSQVPAVRDDLIPLIKERLPLAPFIERHAAARFVSVGRELRDHCVFRDHDDRTPSFYVNPDKQLWRCYGCGRGGDVVSFAQDWLGLDFGPAVDFLAREAGIERPARPAVAAAPVRRLRVREVGRA